MPRRRSLARRSGPEWCIRGGLAIVAAALGYVSVTQTSGYALRGSDPARAYALSSGDGRITAILAGSLSGPQATAADRRRADDLARQALRQDATAVVAVSTLGINAEVRGETASARRLFGYAEALSRRDLQTQLWAIETAVSVGNIAGALRHYDIALRTSRNAPDLLFPILASATADTTIRVALVKTLHTRPAWGGGFINYVAGHAPDARSMAALFGSLQKTSVPVSDFARTSAVNALLAGGFYDDAWSYYVSLRPGADRRTSRDSRFTAIIDLPAPLDWVPVNDAGISSSIQHDANGGVFEFTVPSGVGGVLLQQVLLLPPGSYRLKGHGDLRQAKGVQLYWTLRCLGGAELGRVNFSGSAEEGNAFSGLISVPTGCPAQTLALVARPSDTLGGITGQIDQVLLAPADKHKD